MKYQVNTKEYFMEMALKEAKKAFELGEVPVGAVIVKDEKVIGRGYNMVEALNDPTMHAEMIAIRKACKELGQWRLLDAEIYVTLEPCAMCAGAMVHARLKKAYIATDDYKRGCCGTKINLLSFEDFNHKVEIERYILKDECSKILSNFFKELRIDKKK